MRPRGRAPAVGTGVGHGDRGLPAIGDRPGHRDLSGFCEADPDVYRFVVDTPEGQNRAFGPSPVDSLSGLVADQAGAVLTTAGRDPDVARPWGHGLVGLVRAAADWWLQAERPMLRTELAAALTDLAWSGLAGVVTSATPSAPASPRIPATPSTPEET
ncbi:MAG: hypothetical protein M3P89_00605 [Actinomycetota bacterium]|nr:hypothetical protein [Actinomycetota bacterium]